MSILPASFGKVNFENSWSDGKIVAVVETIVIIQKRMNIGKWSPFSFSDYMERCDHIANGEEKVIIERLASTGYLKIDADGKYNVTPIFLEAIERFADKANEVPVEKKKGK